MTIQEYLSSLRGKTAAVLGIGVSNTPLIELLCRSGVQVIACDKKSREALGERALQLEALGAQLHLARAISTICARMSFPHAGDAAGCSGAARGKIARQHRDVGNGDLFRGLPMYDHRRDRQRRQDHHDEHHRRNAARGGKDGLSRRQHRPSAAVRRGEDAA